MFFAFAVVLGADPTFTVVSKVPAFEVVNRIPAPAKTPVRTVGYPVRGSLWTGCPDWTHLTRGEHAGKFPAAWLQTLTNAEIQALHSDDHEGRVKWQYVPKAEAKPLAFKLPEATYQTCPGGNCPTSSPIQRRGLFR